MSSKENFHLSETNLDLSESLTENLSHQHNHQPIRKTILALKQEKRIT